MTVKRNYYQWQATEEDLLEMLLLLTIGKRFALLGNGKFGSWLTDWLIQTNS